MQAREHVEVMVMLSMVGDSVSTRCFGDSGYVPYNDMFEISFLFRL